MVDAKCNSCNAVGGVACRGMNTTSRCGSTSSLLSWEAYRKERSNLAQIGAVKVRRQETHNATEGLPTSER
jgi:hypothetical protein